MAAFFNIQKPHVLTTLPRPLNHSGGSYVVGDVWSQNSGLRKKRRAELVVGIAGEATNIYDVASSRLVTSYPIPPQSTFTCPPCSLRTRSSKTEAVSRYTYISTQEPTAKLTLFKDVVGVSGHSKSTSVSRALGYKSKLIYLATSSSASPRQSLDSEDSPIADLIAIAEDGAIFCLHGETLQEHWRSSSDILRQDLVISRQTTLKVEAVQAARATDAVEGFFAGNGDAFSALSQKIEQGVYNPDVLIFVTKTMSEDSHARHVHLLALRGSQDPKIGANVIHILTSPFSTPGASTGSSTYRLDVASGSLLELRQGTLFTYSLASSVIKLEQHLQLSRVKSFLRLSKSTVLAATPDSLHIYNPVFKSLQASTPSGLSSQTDDKEAPLLELVAYFARTELAVAVYGASLVAVQLEIPKTRSKKRRAEGLLIDSLGRAVSPSSARPQKRTAGPLARSFSEYIPGSISGDYWLQFEKDMETAEKLFAEKDLAGFEELLAGKFGIELRKHEQLANGTHSGLKDKVDAPLPDWVWPEARSQYPRADRRWIIYAITRVFTWHTSEESSEGGPQLECQLPESSILNFLIDAGHLTVSNLKSAFKNEVRDVDDNDMILGEAIPQLLVQVEPTFEFLLAYLYSTKLGEVELLTAVRLIMQSLELIQDPTKMAPKLLTSSSHEVATTGDEGESGEQGEIGMELDRLEQQIQVTESYLGDQSSTRAKGLSVAFGKLGGCPPLLTIRFLRQHYNPEEILSLIYVLRMELVKDGWTTRYLDTTRLDEAEDLEPPPDGSIRLIADLLCRCIDSVGPGGWLINDAIISAGTGDHFDGADFLASLKLEVSAALEGVQEAVFLRGIISEAARFGASALAATTYKGRKAGDNKSLVTREQKPRELKAVHTTESSMLPLGMKANSRISAEKIHSSGEVVTRSKRDVGAHISKKVQAYSLERIVI